MKLLIFSLIFFVSSKSFPFNGEVGDLIFLSLPCYACSVIESETDSDYSHVGVLLKSPQEEWFVAEAWGKVKLTPLEIFLDKRKKGSEFGHYRIKDINFRKEDLWQEYMKNFDGADYDKHFLWDNYDSQGREILYCSELAAKLLNTHLEEDFATFPMNFERNWDFWTNYFSGEVNIPQNLPGISPQALIDSELTVKL